MGRTLPPTSMGARCGSAGKNRCGSRRPSAKANGSCSASSSSSGWTRSLHSAKKTGLACCAGCAARRGKKATTKRMKRFKVVRKAAGKRKDGRRPEDVTEDFIAPVLGISLAQARGLVRRLKHPIFNTNVLQKSKDGLPNAKRLGRAQILCFNFVSSVSNRMRIEQAFSTAAQEDQLQFDYGRFLKRIQKSCLTSRYRKDFSESMAFTVDNGTTKVYPIYIDGLFPLTTKAIASLILHEALHWFCTRRGRKGNPRLSQEIEHTAMMLLGDKDMAKAV